MLNADRLDLLRADAQGRDVARLIDSVALVEDTRRRLERNVLEDLALEALFDRLRRLGRRDDDRCSRGSGRPGRGDGALRDHPV